MEKSRTIKCQCAYLHMWKPVVASPATSLGSHQIAQPRWLDHPRTPGDTKPEQCKIGDAEPDVARAKSQYHFVFAYPSMTRKPFE